jgi:hypothetical protein
MEFNKHSCSFLGEANADQQNEPQLGLKDQQVLDVKSYASLFSKSIETLRVHLAEKGDGAELIWDKVCFEICLFFFFFFFLFFFETGFLCVALAVLELTL